MSSSFNSFSIKEAKNNSGISNSWSFGLGYERNNISYNFAQHLFFNDNKIIAKLGEGSNALNPDTVIAIAYSLASTLEHKETKNKKVFIGSDLNEESLLFSSIIASVLSSKGYQIYICETIKDLPGTFQKVITHENDIAVRLFISRYQNIKNGYQICFYWGDGLDFSGDDIATLRYELNKIDYSKLDATAEKIDINRINGSETIKAKTDDFFANKPSIKRLSSCKFGIDFATSDNVRFFNKLVEPYSIHFSVFRAKTDKNRYVSKFDNLVMINTAHWFKKNDANFTINNSGSGVSISIKHKSLYKFLSPSQLAATYLYFLIHDDPDTDAKKLNKFYIARSLNTSSLVDSIANQHNIEVFKYTNRSLLYKKQLENKNLLFAFNNNFEFIVNPETLCYDAFTFSLEIMRMIDVYKKQGLTLFDVLNKIYDKYGFAHCVSRTYEMNKSSVATFINRVKDAKKIGDNIVANVREYKNNSVESMLYLKISFTHGAECILVYNPTNEKLTVMTDVLQRSNEKDNRLNVIVREKEIVEGILELKESNLIPKFRPLSIIKYVAFLLIFIGIFIFLFHSVYNFKNSNSVDSPSASVFSTIWSQINQSYGTRMAFISIILGFPVYSFINAMIFKRLLSWQGLNVKFRDLLIGSLISLVSQNVTPKSIGGDIATFWYLRRKGVPRSQLLSAIVINTFVWQVTNIISIIIFIPIGIAFYGNFFANTSDPRVVVMIVSLVLGITIDTTVSTLFLLFALSSKIQKFVLKYVIYLLEWLPFINIYDPEALKSKYHNEFYKLRRGLKITLRKWYRIIELILLKISPIAFMPLAWFASACDMLQSNIKGGYYFNLIVASVLIRNINSISPTPGGTGTGDVISKTIYEYIIKPDEIHNFSITQRSSILTAVKGISEVIIPTLLSGIILTLVFIGEKRIDYLKSLNKNYNLINNISTSKRKYKQTRFYKIALWSFLGICVLSAILFIAIQI